VHSGRFVSCMAFVCWAASGCTSAGERTRTADVITIDAFGDTILAGRPQRIVSLNPATTELVFALGAGDRLVGRTRWDTYPDSARLVPDLGDGMSPNVEAVLAARPDLVLLYASQENRAARDALRRANIPTLTQRIDRIADFARDVIVLARVLGDSAPGVVVRDSVLASVERARAQGRVGHKPRVLWPLWEAPLMSVGRGSFLHELLEIAGAENIFGDLDAPSPQVTLEEAVRRDPEFILVGARNSAIHTDPRFRALRAVREGRVIVYDTTIVSRPGVRLGEAAVHLSKLLHPTVPR
jgi:iron complex transport system substrate-binding protein